MENGVTIEIYYDKDPETIARRRRDSLNEPSLFRAYFGDTDKVVFANITEESAAAVDDTIKFIFKRYLETQTNKVLTLKKEIQ